MPEVIHTIHFPVSARSFVEPIVSSLNHRGINTELWLENNPNHQNVIELIKEPKQFVPCNLVLNPLQFITNLYIFRRKLREVKPKIIHTHQTRASLIPLLAAYLEKVPVRIYHNHGLPYLGYQGILKYLLRLLELININLATHVLIVSHSNLQAARKDRLLPEDKGKVIQYGSAIGIDLSKFDLKYFKEEFVKKARENFNIAESSFVLGYVGRPVQRKGFHLLLKAWEISGLGTKENVLLIAGCTEIECKNAVGYRVPGVKAVGYLPDLQEFYAACDAITLPSHHEGFPYSLLEAAAAAKPLIGTDIPGIRCAIQHNKTGFLVPVNDEEALAKAITELSSNRDLRFELGKNARERVEREFSREIVLEGILNFYKTVLGCD